MYTVDREGNPHQVQKVENYVEIEEIRDDAPSEKGQEGIDIERMQKLLRMRMMKPQRKGFLERYGFLILLIVLILAGAGCWFWMSRKTEEPKVEEPKFGLYF